MSVTSGFFNSVDGDRKYSAEEMGAIFDGIIQNGVFATVGNAFAVTANGSNVNVGIGRAWFDNTWTLNDAPLLLECAPSEILLDRIDAVVIEVNKDITVRTNSIKIIKGVPSSTPIRPIMTKNNKVTTYPLAYIYRPQKSSVISDANIINVVGTTECPFVIGVLKTVDISHLLRQWESQWQNFLNDKRTGNNDWEIERTQEFDRWFRTIRDIISEIDSGSLITSLERFKNVKIVKLDNDQSKWVKFSQKLYKRIINIPGMSEDDRPIWSTYIPGFMEFYNEELRKGNRNITPIMYDMYISSLLRNNKQFKYIVCIESANNHIIVYSKKILGEMILMGKGV